MADTVIVALLALAGTVIGSSLGVVQANKVVNYRIEQLEHKVDKHNNLIERTYNLEKEVAVIEEELKDLTPKV